MIADHRWERTASRERKKLRPKGLCAAKFPGACESSSQIYGNQVRCGLFFKKNLQIEPAFAFYDNPLAQSAS